MTDRRRTSTAAPRLLATLAGVGLAAAALGCPGGGGSAPNPTNTATSGTDLTAAEVDRILAAAAAHAQTLGVPAAIAVTDREGEVLGVFVTPARDANRDGTLETPGEATIQAAISKAATAAAFESEAEAFTTRTAYFIVQGHFPPGTSNTAGGPLFGVQDSGQPSSDAHVLAWDQAGNAVGAGISGVFGGVPLHKLGSPVGGVGVEVVAAVVTASGAATLVVPVQRDLDEAIAMAAVPPELGTPPAIQATNVFVDGIAFPFAEVPYGPSAGAAATTSALGAAAGAIDPRFPVRASPLPAEVRQGGRYGVRTAHRYVGRVGARFNGTFSSIDVPAGATLSSATLTWTGVPLSPLTQASHGGGIGDVRAPSIASLEPPPAEGGLTAAEVDQVIDRACADANRSVAGIRLPRGTTVVVHVAVVDARGNLLGLFRMADGTLFSADVAVQKARTAAFFSSDGTGGVPTVALTARAVGFLAQPFFPPGIQGTEPGPLVRLRDLVNRGKLPVEQPESLTLIGPPPRPPSDGSTDEDPVRAGVQAFNDYGGAAPSSLAAVRALLAARGGLALLADRPDLGFVSPGLQSGLQTFPGGVPLYRGGRLIGGVGVSGDGVDEDDSAAFAGAGPLQPPAGRRCDEVNEGEVIAVLGARMSRLVSAVQAHPDVRIRDVYGPILATEQARLQARLGRGLQGVRIPYVKLPRNPNKP